MKNKINFNTYSTIGILFTVFGVTMEFSGISFIKYGFLFVGLILTGIAGYKGIKYDQRMKKISE